MASHRKAASLVPGSPSPLNKPHLRSVQGSAQPYGTKEKVQWGMSWSQGDAPDTARGRMAARTSARMDWHRDVYLCSPLLGGVQVEADAAAAEKDKPYTFQENAQVKYDWGQSLFRAVQ